MQTEKDFRDLDDQRIDAIVPEDLLENFVEQRNRWLGADVRKFLQKCFVIIFSQNWFQNSGILQDVSLNHPRRPRQRRSGIFIAENVNIEEILKKSYEGDNILKSFTQTKSISKKRSKICHLVMTDIMQISPRYVFWVF